MRTKVLFIALLVLGLVRVAVGAQGEVMSFQKVISQAQTVNPQVRAARHRWESTEHQIIQNYTPVDPMFSFTSSDSPRGFIKRSGIAQFDGHPSSPPSTRRSARPNAQASSTLR